MTEDIKMSEFAEASLVKILGLDSDGNSKKEGLATMIARCLSLYVMLKYNGVIEKGSNLNDLQMVLIIIMSKPEKSVILQGLIALLYYK